MWTGTSGPSSRISVKVRENQKKTESRWQRQAKREERMKKLKSIGFGAVYVAIPFVVNLIIGVELSVQMGIMKRTGQVEITDHMVDKFTKDYGYQLILVTLVNLVIIAGVGLWYYFIRTRRDRSPVDYRKILSPGTIGTMAGVAICAQFACAIVLQIFAKVFPGVYENYQELMEVSDINVLPAWATLLIVAVWAPLAEELVFRAMLFRTLRKGFSFWAAAVISGVVFGVYHMNLVQGVYASLLGFLLAWFYEKTNSLLGCYLFHFLFNLLNYALPAVEESGMPQIVIGIFSLIMILASIPGLIILLRHFSKKFRKERSYETK